tara:strand:+ start:809 stop:1336 length:528 start_codon:yes stop_codon:yes gene_type:complete
MKIKLIILDVDGVLTNGKKYYNDTGLAQYKTFCDKDFSAIKKFRSSSCRVIFLSGDKNINESIASNRGIDFYYSRNKCKSSFISQLKEKYSVLESSMCCIGDDIFDFPIMEKVAYKFCPKDAVLQIKDLCGSQNVLERKGGDNVLDELYDVCSSRGLLEPFVLKNFLKLDKNEKF